MQGTEINLFYLQLTIQNTMNYIPWGLPLTIQLRYIISLIKGCKLNQYTMFTLQDMCVY